MITRYGIGVVFGTAVVAGVVVVGALLFMRTDILRYLILGAAAIAVTMVLIFFRDPERTPPTADGVVISPADGRIVLIRDVFEPVYLKQDAVQVSIFMSPLDVHVNRAPISGEVELIEHHGGIHLPAFDDKSSERNERTEIGVRGTGCRLLFSQVAGTLARRIVSDIAVGQRIVAGQRCGMIRFGSRVDVFMPRGVSVVVRMHDRVVAGETILATYS